MPLSKVIVASWHQQQTIYLQLLYQQKSDSRFFGQVTGAIEVQSITIGIGDEPSFAMLTSCSVPPILILPV